MGKIWFVTGATRGIGAETVKAALAAGDSVAATGRVAAKVAQAFDTGPDRLLALKLDVTDRAQADEAVIAAVEVAARRIGQLQAELGAWRDLAATTAGNF